MTSRKNGRVVVDLEVTEPLDTSLQVSGLDKWGVFASIIAAILFTCAVGGVAAGALALALTGNGVESWAVGVLVGFAIVIKLVRVSVTKPKDNVGA